MTLDEPDAQANKDARDSGGGERPTGAADPLTLFLSQLRGMSDQIGSFGKLADAFPLAAAFTSLRSGGQLPSMPTMPAMPGAVTAAQLGAIAAAVAAQRRSIEAMQTQLSAFDAQLGVLESILGPLTEWSGTWADLERRFTPGAGSPQEKTS